MDRMLYVAMSGAKQNLLAQAVNTHNLANVSTRGFRADLVSYRSMPVFGPGHPSRVYAMAEKAGIDFTPGAINTTGREMDIAIKGEGWIAVQALDGKEAYTRAGNLQVTTAGLLQTATGHPVLGESGPISLPPSSKIEIGSDGSISVLPAGAAADEITLIDRIKLVNPPTGDLYRTAQGLFRLKSGADAEADANVGVVSGALEASNVSAIEAMVNMIDLARQFEMQIKIMKVAEENDESAAQLIRLG